MLAQCVIIVIFVGVEIATGTPNPPTYYPNLPMGSYKSKIKAVTQCENHEKNKLKFNMYASKKSPTKTYLMGNLTLLVPLDDTLSIHINMAVKGSIGGWKENAHVYQSPAACTKYKWLTGNVYVTLSNEFNIPNRSNCPIPAVMFKEIIENINNNCPRKSGVYTTSGVDLEKLKDNNFPKTFFYGEYRMKFSFKSKAGETVGCVNFFVDIIRPWEN